jgi:sulfate permease, SulP family
MVQVQDAEGDALRLRSLGAGTVVGEISHYLQTLATANVVAEEESVVYGLTREDLLRMEEENPVLALAFHRFLASLLSEKLIEQGNILQGMLD